MKTSTKILIIIIIIATLSSLIIVNSLYTDRIDVDNNTVIISVCTADMRALEIGVSAEAGYTQTPLILSDKTIPPQISNWLEGYVQENNITKIVVVGPLSAQEILKLYLMGVNVEQITDTSISKILTKIADNKVNKSNDTIIITASDPLAGVLGAYTNTPVFITATNSSYASSDSLSTEYVDYIKQHNISHIITVGVLPDNLINQLCQLNTTIEELTGQSSFDVSVAVNNKLRQEGYLANTTTAYYGFYGELPTITPTIIKNNAIMIEDSSAKANISQYLIDNNITTVYVTRNKESDYLQMEEEDYLSTQSIKNIEDTNITLKYLTKNRTLDEATGLYDMKILTAQDFKNQTQEVNQSIKNNQIIDSEPPLIQMLNITTATDSNNITATITSNENNYTVKWNTIHPYTWIINSEDEIYATSNTGYEYFWTKQDNTWNVDYKYNNTSYYTVKWIKNSDNSWIESHPNKNYTWIFDGDNWYCFNQEKIIYRINEY